MKNRSNVQLVQKDSTKIVTGKDLAYVVHLAHIRKKKDLRTLMIAYLSVVTEHIHLLVWYHVLNVRETVIVENPLSAVSKTVKLVQLVHSHINQQLRAKIDAKPNVHQECTPILDLHPVLNVPKTSSNPSMEPLPATNAQLICTPTNQVQLVVRNVNQYSVPIVSVSTVDYVYRWVMEFSASAQLDFLADVVKSTLTNVHLNHATMVLPA